MSSEQGYRDLEIDEDIPFQRWEWRAQTLGWVTFAVILGLAAAGLFGDGILSATTDAEGGLEVSYSRFEHHQTPATIDVTAPAEGDELRLWVDTNYLSAMGLQGVSPEPASVEAGEEWQVFVFDVRPGAEEVRIRFLLEPESAGRINGTIRLEQGTKVSLSQLVYP